MKRKIKIGITVDFNIQFHANGLQQNIIFLNNLLGNIPNLLPIYIYTGKLPEVDFILQENCISYSEFVSHAHNEFDLIIFMGFWLDQKVIKQIKEVNKKIKITLMQCGNQFIENSMRVVHYYEKVDYINNPLEGIDAIWMLPQHSQNISYMKTFYRVENIKIAPCIWNPLFIDNQLKSLSLGSENNSSLPLKNKSVVILEPNLSIIKNCLLPIYIVERYERKYPNILSSCNIMGGKKIVDNHYFIRLILQLDIYQKRKGFLRAHNRYKFAETVKLFGSIVVSHQIENDLNYLYFDALYLNLPLIHNSHTLRNYGYYYPHNDIEIASNQLHEIIENHEKNISEYRIKTKECIELYGINNEHNQQEYLKLINEVLNQ